MKKFLIPLIFVFTLFIAQKAHAASFFFSPASGNQTMGKTFSVGVYLNSSDTSVNAVEGTIQFPAEQLQVVSISKSNSIVNLWVKEPAYSNSGGTISFEGVILNPGYQGSNGKIITVTFRPKVLGTASLAFGAGQALANDGSGTNVLKEKRPAQFTVVAAPVIPKTEPKPDAKPAPEPDIVSIEKLEPPTITYITKEMDSGDPLVVKGLTYPNSKVTVWVKSEQGDIHSAQVKSDQDGKFSYIHENRLTDGLYEVWADMSDEKSNKSDASDKVIVNVRPPKVVTITETVTDYITLAITAAALLLLFFLILWYFWNRIQQFRRLIYRETQQADRTVVSKFATLEENVKHIDFLEKEAKRKGMSPEEKYIFQQLKENMGLAKKNIRKEIKDIDDLVN